ELAQPDRRAPGSHRYRAWPVLRHRWFALGDPDADEVGMDRRSAGGRACSGGVLGAAADTGLGPELESAFRRCRVYTVRPGCRVETRWDAAGRGGQTRDGCGMAVVPVGRADV